MWSYTYIWCYDHCSFVTFGQMLNEVVVVFDTYDDMTIKYCGNLLRTEDVEILEAKTSKLKFKKKDKHWIVRRF